LGTRPAYDSISLQHGPTTSGTGYEDSLSLRSLDVHMQVKLELRFSCTLLQDSNTDKWDTGMI
jgi:hypothetical protein